MKLSVKTKEKITSPEKVKDILVAILNAESELDREKEHFWVIGLNTNKTIKYIELVSLGTLNKTSAHPREIFRTAIYYAIDCIIIAHNHPSGEAGPSTQDQKITYSLKDAGELLGISLIDSIIITSSGNYYSFNGNNWR